MPRILAIQLLSTSFASQVMDRHFLSRVMPEPLYASHSNPYPSPILSQRPTRNCAQSPHVSPKNGSPTMLASLIARLDG